MIDIRYIHAVGAMAPPLQALCGSNISGWPGLAAKEGYNEARGGIAAPRPLLNYSFTTPFCSMMFAYSAASPVAMMT
jgi:hypothetical protein